MVSLPASPPSGHWVRWQPEKAAAFTVAVAPALWLAFLDLDGDLGVRMVHEAIRVSGDWALRLFWLTLFVSPARRILSAPRLIRTRRILGLGAFGFTVLHFGLYALDQQFDWGQIALELVLRIYLTIGAVATIGLAALAATSSDRAVAGSAAGAGSRLHRWVFLVAALSAVHFLLRSQDRHIRADVDARPARLARRLPHHPADRRRCFHTLAARTCGQCRRIDGTRRASWHAAATGVDPWLILAAHLDMAYGLRPAWWVLIAGLLATLAGWRWRLSPQRPTSAIRASNAASGSAEGQSAS